MRHLFAADVGVIFDEGVRMQVVEDVLIPLIGATDREQSAGDRLRRLLRAVAAEPPYLSSLSPTAAATWPATRDAMA